MNSDQLLKRALDLDFLNAGEATFLFNNVPTAQLMAIGDELRKMKKKDGNKISTPTNVSV
ncbi:MAG: hypothetical protein IH946_13070 [Bacteroidetes bacterium]|nr:hypothetical protein [Bacteroidota bacterium]